jgi:hypothetical protein
VQWGIPCCAGTTLFPWPPPKLRTKSKRMQSGERQFPTSREDPTCRASRSPSSLHGSRGRALHLDPTSANPADPPNRSLTGASQPAPRPLQGDRGATRATRARPRRARGGTDSCSSRHRALLELTSGWVILTILSACQFGGRRKRAARRSAKRETREARPRARRQRSGNPPPPLRTGSARS